MKQYKDRQREKAFLGAIIGAATSIAGGIISGNKKKKAQERAQAEAQAAQNHKDAIQNAQALTSAYANQDYVDQYYNKFTLKYGGARRKSAFGSWNDITNGGSGIQHILTGVGNLASGITGIQGLGQVGNTIGQGVVANQQINENRRIAQEAEKRKQFNNIRTNSDAIINPIIDNQRNNFINKYRCGGRKKAWIGAAIGAAGSLIGGMFGGGNKSQQPIQVKQADAAIYSAPKTGLINPDWINQSTVQPTIQQTSMPQSIYNDRLKMRRLGGRR